MTLAAKAASVAAAWTLDEASGTRADQVGAIDLTDNNTVLSAAGMFSNAADFEAANSESLSVTDNATVSTGDIDFMFRCWIKIESLDATGVIVIKGDTVTSTCDYALYVGTDGTLNFRVMNPAASLFTTVAWSATLSTATWYLVHAWHDATGNVIGIAVNAGTAVTQAYSDGVRDSAEAFILGAETGATRPYDGLIDDPLLMKGAFLDATERTEDYNAGAGKAFATWAAAGATRGMPFGNRGTAFNGGRTLRGPIC
jgi:concanavalin A-like lectin/glucanase superfamily protein